MREWQATISENTRIAKDIHRMVLFCDGEKEDRLLPAPGQFVHLTVPGKYLRRPLSVLQALPTGSSDGDVGSTLTLVYKVVGEGTKVLSALPCGAELALLGPLGNGYDLARVPKEPILLGGGVGIPPIYALATALKEKKPQVYLGFASEEESFYIDEFRALGVEVHVTIGGYVTDDIPKGGYVLACGPEPMLRAADEKAADGQYSFEARMACGFGACMGCSLPLREGVGRVCKDGPVFGKEDLLW